MSRLHDIKTGKAVEKKFKNSKLEPDLMERFRRRMTAEEEEKK